MVYTCIVDGCESRGTFRSKGIGSHRFPVDEDLTNQWLLMLRLTRDKIRIDSRVCGLHFSPNLYHAISTKRLLKNGAVPDRNLPKLRRKCATVSNAATQTDFDIFTGISSRKPPKHTYPPKGGSLVSSDNNLTKKSNVQLQHTDSIQHLLVDSELALADFEFKNCDEASVWNHALYSAKRETKITPCCVPGCVNRVQDWTAELPRDKDLMEKWKAAILVGTGKLLSDETIRSEEARVCSIHFVGHNEGPRYQEPTLFTRNSMQVEVSCCGMCFRYEEVNKMFSHSCRTAEGSTLWSLAKQHFTECGEQGFYQFYCENCTVHIDMTHGFWKMATYRAKEYEQVAKKMLAEKIEFQNTAVRSVVVGKNIVLGPSDGEGDTTDQFADYTVEMLNMGVDDIVKKEADMTEPKTSIFVEQEEHVRIKEEQQSADPDKSLTKQKIMKRQNQYSNANAAQLFECGLCMFKFSSENGKIKHEVCKHGTPQHQANSDQKKRKLPTFIKKDEGASSNYPTPSVLQKKGKNIPSVSHSMVGAPSPCPDKLNVIQVKNLKTYGKSYKE